MKTHKKTCFIYSRTATLESNHKASSITTQNKLCRMKAKELGYRVLGAYSDVAKSGNDLNRTGLTRLLSACERCYPNAVVVTSVERISRNATGYFFVKQSLKKFGTKIIPCDSPDISDNPLTESIVVSITDFYSKALSNRIKRGLRERNKRRTKNGK